MRREEGETEAEVRGWEDGECFDKDVGRGFVPDEVRVELVSEFGGRTLLAVVDEERVRCTEGHEGMGDGWGQIELISVWNIKQEACGSDRRYLLSGNRHCQFFIR